MEGVRFNGESRIKSQNDRMKSGHLRGFSEPRDESRETSGEVPVLLSEQIMSYEIR